MSSSPLTSQALRVIALGQFSCAIPPLAPRLAALNVAPMRVASLEQLSAHLDDHDILLTEQAWLNGLSATHREELGRRAAQTAGWITLTDGSARFKDQIGWQRLGVDHFFQQPLDAERVAALVENIHDRLAGPPIRAILIDDDETSLAYYGEALRQNGVAVVATSDPLLVLDALEAHRPDVLVLDIEMPGCRGPELATIVRQRPAYARLPVIFLTAMEGMQDKLLARAAAAEEFLVKPVAPELLWAAVESHARRYRAFLRGESLVLQQQAQARLRLEQLRQAVDEHAIVSIADAKGNIIYANDKFCALSGFTRQELLGENHRMVKSGLHPKAFYRDLWATITSGNVWHGEVCNRRKGGGIYWVEASIVPILNSKGEPVQFISIRTDITALKANEEALRIGEERLRRGQEFANIGTWDWNIETGELYWSERIAPLFGYAVGDLATSYENFLSAIHPDDRDAVTSAVNACIAGAAPYAIEHRVVWPDGTVRWLSERGAVVRNADGVAVKMLGVVQDVTERVTAEARLRETEERFSFAVEGAGDGIWDWNIETGVMLLSGCYEEMLGFSKGEIEPTVDAWVKSVHPDDLAQVQENLQGYLDGRLPSYEVELRLCRKDGGFTWILCRGTVVARDENGRPIRMIGIHSDISVRKLAEENLRIFQRLFEASEQGVGVGDPGGHIIYSNPAHDRIHGYSHEKVIGAHFTLFLSEATRAWAVPEIMAAITAGKPWTGKLPVVREDGSERVTLANVGSIANEKGELQYVFNIMSDYSEELARQQQLAESKEAAERANQAKSDFLSSMSHELRTPMNAIIGFAQMLDYDSELNDDQKDNVHEILKAGRHLLELINEVLDLAKIESGRIALSLESVDLVRLVADCLPLVQPLATARRISLHLELPQAISVRADRVRLKQVLLNLLSNAIKYNRDGGEVRLEAREASMTETRITVADTGVGISSDRMDELFQPFHRLEAEHSSIEGTGIGLTITRRLTELMGGRVGVDSETGIGSRFWIELPTDIENADAVEALAETNSSINPSRQYQVLCIDDNPVNLKLIAQIFGMKPNIHLLTAPTPDLGIELALAQRPDLILLDINMPGMNGYQVLKVFQADAGLKSIPVVAITANAMPRDIERGMAAGFTAYLTKPLDIGVFLETVSGCLPSSDEEFS